MHNTAQLWISATQGWNNHHRLMPALLELGLASPKLKANCWRACITSNWLCGAASVSRLSTQIGWEDDFSLELKAGLDHKQRPLSQNKVKSTFIMPCLRIFIWLIQRMSGTNHTSICPAGIYMTNDKKTDRGGFWEVKSVLRWIHGNRPAQSNNVTVQCMALSPGPRNKMWNISSQAILLSLGEFPVEQSQ